MIFKDNGCLDPASSMRTWCKNNMFLKAISTKKCRIVCILPLSTFEPECQILTMTDQSPLKILPRSTALSSSGAPRFLSLASSSAHTIPQMPVIEWCIFVSISCQKAFDTRCWSSGMNLRDRTTKLYLCGRVMIRCHTTVFLASMLGLSLKCAAVNSSKFPRLVLSGGSISVRRSVPSWRWS